MVRLEFLPVPDHPKGFTFDSDTSTRFELNNGQFVYPNTGEVLAQSIVDQLVKEYHDYPMDGQVYCKGTSYIHRQVDRSPWLPAIYDQALGIILEAFNNSGMSPVRLIQVIHDIKYNEIQVEGCPQYFYVRLDVRQTGVFLEVMFYYTREDKQTVMTVCELKDD